MNSSALDSPAALQQAFSEGLARLLASHRELGVFILVMANAGFDQELHAMLAPALAQRFRLLSLPSEADALTGGEDDRLVFQRIVDLGLEALWPVQFRHLGPWELQFNPMRALRPARTAAEAADAIQVEFDRHGFHFGAPFLRKEILWHGHLCGRSVALFFNKFPFVERHTILVPEPSQGRPQFLERADQRYLWQVAERLGERLPTVGFGYNSYGAYASVNHLHFQMFCRTRPLAIGDPQWRHNGGDRDYPLDCRRFDAVDEAWAFIDGLHRCHCSYNLIQLPGRLYCLPRQRQDGRLASHWSEGFAWYETAGGFITSSEQEFGRLSAKALEQALASLRLDTCGATPC